MTACTHAADCVGLLYVNGNQSSASNRNWCLTSTSCVNASCVVWPRCRAYPYLGCQAATQLCASVHNEPQNYTLTPSHTAAEDSALTNAWTILTLIGILMIVAIVSTCIVLYRAGASRRPGDTGKPVAKPAMYISLDAHYALQTQ